MYYISKVTVISAGIIEQKAGGFILQTVMKRRTNIALISILRYNVKETTR